MIYGFASGHFSKIWLILPQKICSLLSRVLCSHARRSFPTQPELKWDKGTKWDSMYDDRVKSCITELKASTFSALGNFFAEFKSS